MHTLHHNNQVRIILGSFLIKTFTLTLLLTEVGLDWMDRITNMSRVE